MTDKLYLLLVSDFQWDILSIDFVVEIHESFRYNVVMTVVDFLSKQAYFIPTHTTIIAEEIV